MYRHFNISLGSARMQIQGPFCGMRWLYRTWWHQQAHTSPKWRLPQGTPMSRMHSGLINIIDLAARGFLLLRLCGGQAGCYLACVSLCLICSNYIGLYTRPHTEALPCGSLVNGRGERIGARPRSPRPQGWPGPWQRSGT
jgi:hypothetical protein